MYDIIVIGAGVSGCAAARYLAMFDYKIAVLEKESDICEGTSKANSGIVHAGFDTQPGTLKSKLNVRGNVLMEELSQQLDIPFKRNGSLVLSFSKEDLPKLEELLARGQKNSVPNLRILNKEQVKELEPSISDNVVAALYAPTGGIVCPFELTIALAENACTNGVEFFRDTEVLDIMLEKEGYRILTNAGEFQGKVVINAAGVYADKIHGMCKKPENIIVPRKGEYCLYDKTLGGLVSHTIFQMPTEFGKGVLVTPTIHGNLMTGPTAVDIEDKEDTSTTAKGLDTVLKMAGLSVPDIPGNKIITSFSGLRAHSPKDDFVIEEVKGLPGFIDVACMESPGLSSAPAVGEMVAQIVLEILPKPRKTDFVMERQGILRVAEMSAEELRRLILKDPTFANVICRCETVTEGEIVEAIRRPVGARTLDGIKRRTRAGMGRCQAGFCSPKTVDILARELGVDISEITKCGRGSEFLVGTNKDNLQESNTKEILEENIA